MRYILLLLPLLLLCVAMDLSGAKKTRDWKTGRIVDQQKTTIVVSTSEYIYTAEDIELSEGLLWRAIDKRKHNCRFIVGEDIKFSQQKKVFYVIDADGKQCELELKRQEKRNPNPETK